MEHEVHVPFPVGSVRAALAEPERGIRCVPGLKLDAVESVGSSSATAGADGVTESVEAAEVVDAVEVRGRLRVRIAGSTITYRGTLRLGAEGPGFTVEAEGTEARGDGSAQLLLTVVPRPSDATTEPDGSTEHREAGTTLAVSGTISGQGRIAEFDESQLQTAGRRLVDRFGAALRESLAADPPGDDNARVIPGIPAPEDGSASESASASGPTDPADAAPAPDDAAPGNAPTDASDVTEATETSDATETSEETGSEGDETVQPELPEAVQDEKSGLSVFETEIPPPSLDPADEEAEEPAAEIPAPGLPPAEAAHARRTMIGRSAEEVDHAPPRGRYAPVPPPEPASSGATLRWAAPAAAVVLASAVVFSRVMRRRGR